VLSAPGAVPLLSGSRGPVDKRRPGAGVVTVAAIRAEVRLEDVVAV
jgi:hypothetical protein